MYLLVPGQCVRPIINEHVSVTKQRLLRLQTPR